MHKAILSSVILGSLMATAQAADVKWSGEFGYRNDSLEYGSTDIKRDRFRAGLVAKADVNDKTKVVVGVRTGSVKSAWNDMTGSTLKNVDLNLAYAEYAAAPFAKVTLGKMNQPWVTEGLMFDNDIKPEGLAVALKHGSGLTANIFKLKLSEELVGKDSTLVGLQLGGAKEVGGVNVAAHAALLKQEVVIKQALCIIYLSAPTIPVCNTEDEVDQVMLTASATKEVAGLPVKVYAQHMVNKEAKNNDTALAYGIKVGNVKKAGDWQVDILKQDTEVNALSNVWVDSDFGGEALLHDGIAIRAAYGLADGWALRGSYYDVEVGPTKTDYKRLMLDLAYTF